MEMILTILSVAGDVGVWVVVFGMLWLERLIYQLRTDFDSHKKEQGKEEKRTNSRLKILEGSR